MIKTSNINTSRKYDKPHKFFEKFLDNDLDKLAKFLEQKYKQIELAEIPGVSKLGEKGKESWLDSGSLSTIKWSEYNVFQFYNEELYKLFLGVRETVKEACDYYGVNFEEQQYMIQGWFNITHKGKGKLNWHDHGGPWAPFFHGYYSVKAEPSSTYYKIDNDENKIFENKNLDNRLILSEMGHPHAMADWDWEGSRITIAYDIMPLWAIKGSIVQQHYFPL
jgi:hypothetical protein